VASSTLSEPRWADTTVIAGEVAGLSELKAGPGGELQVHGSGALVRWLLENELVDEINLKTAPVIIGQGTRLFADTGPDVALDLVDTRTTPNGVTIQVFRPSGRPEYATSTAKGKLATKLGVEQFGRGATSCSPTHTRADSDFRRLL
jgi:dihydrofolate reductase